MIFKGYLFSVLYAAACLILAFIVYKLGVKKEITRKLVHILVGFEWVILYTYMGESAHFLAVCIAFTLILAVTYFAKLMPMISSSDDNAPGTVYYGVAMTVMSIISLVDSRMLLPFGVGVFCTSLGDGLAGLVGQSVKGRFNPKIYANKSLVGSLTNLLVSFGVVFGFSRMYGFELSPLFCLAVAVLSVEHEMFTGKGLDNITITVGTSLLTFSLMYFEGTVDYIVPILLTPIVIAVSYSKKALTLGGIIGALLLDVIVSTAFLNQGFVLLMTFFVGSVITDKIKKRKKADKSKTEELEQRGDCRCLVQVLANGLIPAICSVLYIVTGSRVFLLAYVASLSEAFADTAASSIGSMSGKAYDIFRFKRCEAGLSGGVSLIGTAASVVASALLSLIAFLLGTVDIFEMLIISALGFGGGLFDSLLGSFVQVKYKCKVCERTVEKREHCSTPTVYHSGIPFINNDAVNLLGTAFSAALALLIFG